MKNQSPVIETERLTLRRWRLDDAEALFKYASDPRVTELALWPTHTSPEMSRDVLRDIFIPNPDSFAMVLKSEGAPVGCIGLVPRGGEHHTLGADEREVGYWIGYPHWGKGLTTEALTALIDYCRATSGLRYLLITIDIRNGASGRVAKKCGFRFVEDYEYDGIPGRAYRLPL